MIIRKAVYGELPNGVTVDVTEKVRAMVKNGALSVAANNTIFGDPYNGKMKLTIIKAEARESGMNFGDSLTDMVKSAQNGDMLDMKLTGLGTLTVYYKYGNGETRSTKASDDGTVAIEPPTKLRVDYTLNGVEASKTVNLFSTLVINN